MRHFFTDPVFSIFITLGCYLLFVWLAQKLAKPWLNPLALTSFVLVFFIHYTKLISVEQYMVVGRYFTIGLTPLMVALAVPLYYQRFILLKKWPIFLIGTVVSIITSLLTTVLPAKYLQIDEQVVLAMSPKAVSTPIAIELAGRIDAIVPLATIAVVVAGLTGYVLGPAIVKVVAKDSPVAQGFAIGAASHILGTVGATQLGELQAACSTIAISSVGITMTFLLPLLLTSQLLF